MSEYTKPSRVASATSPQTELALRRVLGLPFRRLPCSCGGSAPDDVVVVSPMPSRSELGAAACALIDRAVLEAADGLKAIGYADVTVVQERDVISIVATSRRGVVLDDPLIVSVEGAPVHERRSDDERDEGGAA